MPYTAAQAQQEIARRLRTFELETPGRLERAMSATPSAARDLRNVLAGHNVTDPRPATRRVNATLDALPTGSTDLNNTHVGLLLQMQTAQAQRMLNQELQGPAHQALRDQIRDVHISNTAELERIRTQIFAAYNPRDKKFAQRTFDAVLRQKTIEARFRFEQQNPTHIAPTDSAEQIEGKVAAKNAAFSQQMADRRSQLNRALGGRTNIRAIGETTSYINSAFKYAGRLHAQFADARRELSEASLITNNTLAEASLAEQAERAQHGLEASEAELKRIQEGLETPQQQAAFEWAVRDRVYEARFRSSPTNANREALQRNRAPFVGPADPTGRPPNPGGRPDN